MLGSAGTDTIVAASRWVEGALLGSLATAAAVLAVAGIGFLMLTGRIELRRGATVVLGCFVLFGAAGIARALPGLAYGDGTVAVTPAAPVTVMAPAAPPAVPAVTDPYAGASVPRNR